MACAIGREAVGSTGKDLMDHDAIRHAKLLWFQSGPVRRLTAGDAVARHWVAPADGWYVSDFCGWGCCPPEGPFPDRDSAIMWVQQRIEDIRAGRDDDHE